MAEFKLAVDRLTGTEEHHVFEAGREWWEDRDRVTRDELFEIETPFRFDLRVKRVHEEIILEGGLTGRVGLECSRCAKRYSQALREDFRLVLSPVKDRVPADPEGVRGLSQNGLCLGEDLEAGWFKGPVIRLDDFLGEVVALSIPLQPLCRSDCPGICPHCGADLSQTQCGCVDEKIDSPFAVLAKLKGRDDPR